MQRIISHIEYLLDRHDCVTVPGFGAFIKASCPASIEPESGIIRPPHRSLTFNSELTFDDGLLATSYSRAMNQPYTVASSLMAKDVELLKSSIKLQPTVKLGCIGSLSQIDGLYNFNPADSLFVDFGMPIASVHPIEDQRVEEQTAVILPAPNRFTHTLRGVMKYAAMFVVLITVGIVLSTPFSDTTDYEVIKASMSPIASTADDDSSISYFDIDGAPAFLIAEPNTGEDVQTLPTDHYCLVIASLASRELADTFMSEYSGMPLGVVENGGRYRVFAATGPTLESVMNQDLLASFPDAWPCRLN